MDQQDNHRQRASSNERLADLLETLAARGSLQATGSAEFLNPTQRRAPNEAGGKCRCVCDRHRDAIGLATLVGPRRGETVKGEFN